VDTQKVIEGLNKDLSMEYAAVIQLMQHAFLMQGYEREYLAGTPAPTIYLWTAVRQLG